jgi:ligand-binding sensor domain-containing protein
LSDSGKKQESKHVASRGLCISSILALPQNNRLIAKLTYVLLLLLPFSGWAQQYNFRNFTVKDGVAQSQVYALLQDHRGYLWMGTRGGGITRFDGIRFQTFTEKDGLVNSYIHRIREDRRNRLWITTNNGISVYDGVRFTNHIPTGYDGPVSIYDIAFDRKGRKWLASGVGVLLFEDLPDGQVGGKFFNITRQLGLPNLTVNSVLIDRKNRIWIATGKGLYRIDFIGEKPVLKTLSKESHYMSNAINTVREDEQGNIWIGTYGDGAYRYDGYHYSRIDFHHELYTRTVLDIFCERDNIWFATLNHGVVQYNLPTKKFASLTENEGLSNNHVRSIIRDNGGSLWFGTSGGGVCNYFGKQFTTYDKSSGLGGNFIYSIFRDSRKRLWIGTSQKGVSAMLHSRFSAYGAASGFADVKVKAIAEGDDGWIYFGTDGQGVYAYDGAQFSRVPRLESLYVRGMKKDRKGTIWIATAGSGLVQLTPNGTLQPMLNSLTVNDGLLQNRLTCLHIDGRDRIWYGTETSGIGMIEGGVAQKIRIRTKEGLRSDAIRSLTEDQSGYLWIGTAGAGIASVAIYHGNHRPTCFNHINGLTSSNIYLLTVDRSNNLIVGTETGLDYLSLNQNRKITSIRHYGKGEGFTGIETCQNAVFGDEDGTIWFGTINGLSRYNPANSVKNMHEPITTISDVRLFYESLGKTVYKDAIGDWNVIKELYLPYDQNHLSFDFFAINFSNPEAVKYKWKLAGFDEEWSPATTEHSIVYSNISPGNYTFLVKACNEDGIWNKKPVMVMIHISAPFWQQWWFILLETIAVLGLLIGLFKWQSNRIRAKSAEAQRQLQMAKEMVELEQKALRLQMNPHFIFNALNSIQSQIGTGNEQEARYYLAKFSRLMRQILDNSRNALITLEEEITTLENYLLIEQFCNGNRFDYAITVDASLEHDFVKLPPMLLQPFVENAIKHGFRFSDTEDPGKRGHIAIHFAEKGNVLECSVTDNGIGRNQAAELNKNSMETYHQSTALRVTQERLDLLQLPAGEGGLSQVQSLEIIDLTDEQGHATGTKVIVRIPIG